MQTEGRICAPENTEMKFLNTLLPLKIFREKKWLTSFHCGSVPLHSSRGLIFIHVIITVSNPKRSESFIMNVFFCDQGGIISEAETKYFKGPVMNTLILLSVSP